MILKLFPQAPSQFSIPQLWRHFHQIIPHRHPTAHQVARHKRRPRRILQLSASRLPHRRGEQPHGQVEHHLRHTHPHRRHPCHRQTPTTVSHCPAPPSQPTQNIPHIVRNCTRQMHFPSMRHLLQTNTWSWYWLPIITSSVKCRHHAHRTLLGAATSQPYRPDSGSISHTIGMWTPASLHSTTLS